MTFRAGDIIAYTPETLFRRDGYAEVKLSWDSDEPFGTDTFDRMDTRLTDAELTTGRVLFNLEEYVEQPFIDESTYAPADVFAIRTRKGMVWRKFVRRGARMLPESQIAARRAVVREQDEMRARAHMLSPLADQAYPARDLPVMTVEETAEIIDTVRWVQRASREFTRSFDYLVQVVSTGDGNLNFQSVHTDEYHFELVRARRALDKKLAALRG